MIVKNEEATLRRCLESVQGIVNEIVIIDTGSKDNTREIARSYRAKVYDFEWTGSFADARNFALQHSTSDWNLILDADEYITNDCRETIRNFIGRYHALGRIKIVSKFVDQEGTGYAHSFATRLFPSGLFYQGRIHEQVQSDLPRIKLNVEVQHDGYYQKNKSDRNIPILEQEIKQHPNDPYFYYQIAKEYTGLQQDQLAYKSLVRANELLTRKEAYAPNVIVAYMYAIVATQNWEEGLKVIEREHIYLYDYADFHFVSGVFFLDLILSDPEKYIAYLPRIEQSYLSCLEIGENEKYDNVIGTGSFKALYNLGVFNEVMGKMDNAVEYYKQSASYHYQPAINRLNISR
ncbi:glycosyltransferase family 2 protein [Paenibacillus guangzhouensis]|uniref:glycosyltransferase family 2 protein n=1 Tax=Paenibacillus guangzhouensis TaxID=1473112 RepID=UPI001267112D|nr:glycosyltransferase family 2 protein [Paenibacillus guangzhouensis]